MLRKCLTVEFQRLDPDAEKVSYRPSSRGLIRMLNRSLIVEFKRLDPDAEKVFYRRVPEA
jgi:hypothetical protein